MADSQRWLARPFAFVRLAAAGLGVALVVVGATSCGGSEPVAFPEADGTIRTGGVVVMDGDGDGELSDGDLPVAGAQIERLSVSVEAMKPVPDSPIVTTEEGGAFVLESGRVSSVSPPGVQVGLELALENGRGAGLIHFRYPVEADVVTNVVVVPSDPKRCAASGSRADGVPAACDQLRLPDLEPIITQDQIEPGQRFLPDARSDAFPSPGGSGVLPPETWFVAEEDGRRLLRFASLTANVGAGVLDVIAEPGEGDRQQTWQRVWASDLSYWDRRSGEFLFHEGHAHIHFDAFERYRLLDDSGEVVAESAKVSFCLRDSIRVSDEPQPTVGVFTTYADSCGEAQQSINPGWGDHYNELLPDQWIDITGVASGDYTVEITVDPEDTILEADESNNVGTFAVTIEPVTIE